MSCRSIVVHLDDSPRCAVRVDIAARLACEHGAHLLGLAPAGRINLPARVTPSLTGVPNYLELAQARLDEHAAGLVRAFRQRVEGFGLPSFEGRVAEDDSVPALLAHARAHDLVVLGQTDRTSPGVTLEQDIPEQVFMQAGMPVLVVPHAGDVAELGRCVVVAWNASRESSRALRDALPLLHRASSVHLMCFERPSDLVHVPRQQLHDLRDWLGRYGIEMQFHQEPVRVDIGDALLSRACDLGADLVVMGGYGHSRMAEFLFGGVTRRLLAQMTVPVLISH